MRVFIPRHLCWRPDVPDFRDLIPGSPEIRQLMPESKPPFSSAPDAVDLSDYLLTYSDSSLSTTCPSSIVCTKLVEYFNFRCAGRIEPLNARFVMQAVSALSNSDCSGIRTNLRAIRHFGIPAISSGEADCKPDHGPIEPGRVGNDEYRSMYYLRLGEPSEFTTPLQSLKAWLASGFPIAFGFSVPSSLDYDGFIDFRPTYDSIQGGHAALMVGFDDGQLSASRGAFRVYCPWGNEWGDQGFGWLPYTFIERRIALDFWTILKSEWINSGDLFQQGLG